MQDIINKCHKFTSIDFCKSLPDASIDHIVTDPPYNIGYAEWDKFFNVEEVTAEWHRILKPNGSILIFTGWSFAPELIAKFNSNFRLNDWIIYDRIKGRGAKKRLVSTREDILWYVHGDEWIFNKDIAYSTIPKKTGGLGLKNGRSNRALSNVWTDISPIVPWSKERNGHTTQKPLQIMSRIVSVFTSVGDVILDPYAGSGTTGEACVLQGRIPILVDYDQEWVDFSNNRLEKSIKSQKYWQIN